MKRRLVLAAAILSALITAAIALTCVRPPAGHYDFNLRMNELACLRQGVNPFSVWNEETVLPPYCSNLPKNPVPENCTEPVNAYAPWSYTYLMPFSFLSRPVAWFLYCVFMGLSLACAVVLVRAAHRDAMSSGDGFLLVAVPMIVVSYLVWSNVSVGNVIVFTLAGSVAMAAALTKGRGVLAGLCWAIAMIKPQSAILFAVPLLLRPQWKTCFVAGGFALAASFLPVRMCGTPLFDLLRQGPAANEQLFDGCGTWPKFLCGFLPPSLDIGMGLVIGLLLCVAMTVMLRREKDWFTLLMPAAVCGASWTYTQAYSHAMCWFLAFVVFREWLVRPRCAFLATLSVLCVPVVSRAFLAAHGFCLYFGCRFPLSEYAYRCVDSFNSTLTLALAFAFCLWKNRHPTMAPICSNATASRL